MKPSPSISSATDENEISFLRLIGVSISTKLLADSTYQIFNPFLPMIAAGLGTNLTVIGQMITWRNLVSLVGPFVGTVADRSGYRFVIRLGLLLLLVGTLMVGSSQGVTLAAAGMLIMGVAHVCIGPMLQAYISTRLPYSQRARGIGMLEYSWALTGIVGLSLLGVLLARTNWRWPFFLLAAGIAGMWFVFGGMPEARSQTGAYSSLKAMLRGFFRLGANARSIYATMVAGAFNYFAASQLMITYSTWLNDSYGLQAAQLGMVAMVLGVFDLLLGSVLVSLFTDRLGKRNSVLLGSLVALVGYCLIPIFNRGAIPAVLTLALSRGGFEFAIVSNISLLSEQAPSQRGKALTLGGALWQLFGAMAGLSAPWLYTHWNVSGIAIASAICVALALVTALFWMREIEEQVNL